MATSLVLLCSAATASGRSGAFARPEEPLDASGAVKARATAIGQGREEVACSPARAACETARAIGAHAVVDPRLAEMDFGRWRGRSVAELRASDPLALARWLEAPEAGAPDGETFAEVRRRVRSWLAEACGAERRLLAITHPFVVRAALAEALELPSRSVMRFDVAPLSASVLSFNRVWRLQRFGAD